MGYRPNIVKRYEVEYGSEIGGFNYDPQGLDNFFSSLDLDFSWEYSEKLVESVVKILVSALDSDYCKNYDMVKIEFL